MSDNDVFDEAPQPGSNSLAAVQELAEGLVGLEEQLEDLEVLVEQLKGRANVLKTKTIPDKMAEVGLTEFTMVNGNKVKVEDFLSGSLPKDPEKREIAIKRLTEWGADGIIRSELVLPFEKSQFAEAEKIAAELRKKGFAPALTASVHPQTYLAFLRERMKSGEKIEADEMGVFAGRKTKINMSKEYKAEKAARK